MNNIIKIESISAVHKLLDLPKPKHPLVSVIELNDNVTQFDYGDSKYVFDFYQINLKKNFSGSLTYGRNSYDFDEGSLTFIKPNQSIQIEPLEATERTEGWTLLFHPDLLRKSELGRTIEDYSFFDYSVNEALHLSDDERVALTDLVFKIEAEYNQNIDKHSQELIIANIEMMLKYSKRFYDRQFYTRTNLNKDVLDEFNRIVRNYYNSGEALSNGVLTVNHCARKLNLSDNYLSDLIKAETGLSAKASIQDFVVDLAKTKLLGSNDSISQIAYSLGFEHPAGFNKMFKNKVGSTPTDFRTVN